jgi:hypothetical protein
MVCLIYLAAKFPFSSLVGCNAQTNPLPIIQNNVSFINLGSQKLTDFINWMTPYVKRIIRPRIDRMCLLRNATRTFKKLFLILGEIFTRTMTIIIQMINDNSRLSSCLIKSIILIQLWIYTRNENSNSEMLKFSFNFCSISHTPN